MTEPRRGRMPWFTWPLMPLALPGLIVAIRMLLPMMAVALTTSGVALNLYLVYRFGTHSGAR